MTVLRYWVRVIITEKHVASLSVSNREVAKVIGNSPAFVASLDSIAIPKHYSIVGQFVSATHDGSLVNNSMRLPNWFCGFHDLTFLSLDC